MRWSSSERGGLTLTVAEKNGKVAHYRASRIAAADAAASGYLLREQVCATLCELLESARRELSLGQPIEGSCVAAAVMRRVARGTTQDAPAASERHFAALLAATL